TSSLRAYAVMGLNALLGRNRPPPVDAARMRQMDSIRMQNRARIDSVPRSQPSNPPGRRVFSSLIRVGDTIEARRQLAQLDAELARMSGGNWLPRVTAMHLSSATNHLALGDTAGADARLAEIEQAFNYREFRFSISFGYGPWLGDAWLLSGDLAAARRRFAEAARMYHRVIGLWTGGDPNTQPPVYKARRKLQSLPR